jgi:Tol biopolymer transport system component
VSPSGGPVERIPTSGVPNPTEPDWSPDNKWIAFTSQWGGGFDICVMPSKGGDVIKLVAGEDPSWSPNSRTLIFARHEAGRLALLDVFTKQWKDIARVSSGVNSQPSWAK